MRIYVYVYLQNARVSVHSSLAVGLFYLTCLAYRICFNQTQSILIYLIEFHQIASKQPKLSIYFHIYISISFSAHTYGTWHSNRTHCVSLRYSA